MQRVDQPRRDGRRNRTARPGPPAAMAARAGAPSATGRIPGTGRPADRAPTAPARPSAVPGIRPGHARPRAGREDPRRRPARPASPPDRRAGPSTAGRPGPPPPGRCASGEWSSSASSSGLGVVDGLEGPEALRGDGARPRGRCGRARLTQVGQLGATSRRAPLLEHAAGLLSGPVLRAPSSASSERLASAAPTSFGRGTSGRPLAVTRQIRPRVWSRRGSRKSTSPCWMIGLYQSAM